MRTNPQRFHRTRDKESLLVFEHEGSHYTIRQDRDVPSLFHWKLTWPSGRRYWRPIHPEAWAHFPKEVQRRILDRFGVRL